MLETVKALFQQLLAGFNLPVLVAVAVGVAASSVVVSKASKGYKKARLKSKMVKTESKIRHFAKAKDSTRLAENLLKLQKLRTKAAKKLFQIKTEYGTDISTLGESKLTKGQAAEIKRDAKATMGFIKSSMKGKNKKAVKLQSKMNNVESKFGLKTFVEKISFANVELELPTNMIAVNSEKMVEEFSYFVQNAGLVNSAERKQGKGVFPMVMQITDQNNNVVFKLSDVEPARFMEFSKKGLGYLNSIMKQDNSKNQNPYYKIEFFDTLHSPEKVQPIVGTASDVRQLKAYLRQFVQSINKNYKQFDFTYEAMEYDVLKNTEYYTNESNQENVNSITYHPDLSENLKSERLNNVFKNYISKHNYTGKDSMAASTTLAIDGKSILTAVVESEELRIATEKFVDAYAFAISVFRKHMNIDKQMIMSKTIQKRKTVFEQVVDERGVDTFTTPPNIPDSDKGKQRSSIYPYFDYQDDETQIFPEVDEIYAKNKEKPGFFAAVVSTLRDMEAGIDSKFLKGLGVKLEDYDARLLDENLKQFKQAKHLISIEDFGLSNPDEPSDPPGGNSPKSPSSKPSVRPNQAKDKQAQPSKAYINTTNADLEKEFENEILSLQTNDGQQYRAEIIYNSQSDIEINFHLGLQANDKTVYDKYLYQLLLEAHGIISQKDAFAKTSNKINLKLVINYPNAKGKVVEEIRKFSSLKQLNSLLNNYTVLSNKEHGFTDEKLNTSHDVHDENDHTF